MLFAAIITSLMGAFTVVSAGVAKPAVKEHFDCEYTGVLPGTVATGVCTIWPTSQHLSANARSRPV
jgi:hypothetical protein